VHTWRRSELSTADPSALLQAHGPVQLLFAGAVLCGKLVKCQTSHVHYRLEAALLGVRLASAVFTCSLAHPQRALNFANYFPTVICEGQDLFADEFALKVADVMEGTDAIASALLDGHCALECLPLMALWEWAAYHVARNSAQVVRCRVLRVQALCKLGCLADAVDVVVGLMKGLHIPDALCPRDLPLTKQRARPVLNPSVPVGATSNTEAVQFLCKGGVLPKVAAEYGPWACAQIAMARAAVLQGLGCHAYAWKHTHPLQGRFLDDNEAAPAQVALLPFARAVQINIIFAAGESTMCASQQAAAETTSDRCARRSKAAWSIGRQIFCLR
jgi:hypothetical protein